MGGKRRRGGRLRVTDHHAVLQGICVQNLWNWFVAEVLRAANMSYPQAFGVMLVVFILTNRQTPTTEDDERWKKLMAYAEAAVPDAKQNDLVLPKKRSDILSTYLMESAELFVDTGALLIGFGIHTFLM
jgi:hypothetical protein